MGPQTNKLIKRNYIDQNMIDTKEYPLLIANDKTLKSFPFEFQVVRVQQNPLYSKPKISFYNGYDKKEKSFSIQVNLDPTDRHLFGDSINRNTTRKEFFTFISITEVAFYEGGFIQYQDNDKLNVFSGIKNKDYYLACQDLVDVDRTAADGSLSLNRCI